MPKTKTKSKTSKVKNFSAIKTNKRLSLSLIALITLLIAAIGAYLLFFAAAATNNCQTQGDLKICDVNQVIKADGSDALLSVGGDAESLGINKWGTYYGAAFRAPTTAYKGAEPMYRLYTHSLTLHTVKFGPEANQTTSNTSVQTNNEGLQFYAWRSNPNLPGVVPIYRVTGTGWSFVDVFVSSTTVYNQLRGDKAAWQDGGVAFWAYPDNYTIPGQTNPFDCQKPENYTSDRCAGARQEVINKINEDAKQAAGDTSNKPATGTPSSSSNTQNSPSSSSGGSGATSSGGSTPAAPAGVDCSAPNPSQATKDACLKQLATYLSSQPAPTKAQTVAVSSIPQPTNTQDCTAPNPSDFTKEYCRGRFWGAAALSGGKLPDDLPNCSAPNPSELVKAFCQGQFYGSVTQAKYNEQKKKEAASLFSQAEAASKAQIQNEANQNATNQYLKSLSIIENLCNLSGYKADPQTLKCVPFPKSTPVPKAPDPQPWTCKYEVKYQGVWAEGTKKGNVQIIANGYTDAANKCLKKAFDFSQGLKNGKVVNASVI